MEVAWWGRQQRKGDGVGGGGGGVSAGVVALLLGASAAALLLSAHLEEALPEPRDPRTALPGDFVAHNARQVLLNLTDIGPRVAGSHQNEVLGAGAAAAAVRWAAVGKAPHHELHMQVHTASGAFPITFFDGMVNVYRDVQSVVARLSAAGPHTRPRPALLLNCHYDTVPGSPGASDDAAGCGVLVEVLRALAAGPPAPADLVLLLNGAEENIMQGSHAFVTKHPWARTVRAFVNLEACGAGGREVLFQAGPHEPWIMETYARVVPRPYASSLAQELFESGLVPGDTDFRVFRDFGNLSGVDLAWSANGYVYHTHLDTADRVPLGALQRTGDNVLALVRALLHHPRLRGAPDSARQPVFFDVLGRFTVTARPELAVAAALGTLALAALALRGSAKRAGVGGAAYARDVCAAGAGAGGAAGAGLGAAAAVGGALHYSGHALAYYARPWLAVVLFVAPALGVTAAAARRWRRGGAAAAARRAADAVLAGWALALAVALSLRLRSAFVPLQWTLLLALADRVATITHCTERGRWLWWQCGGLAALVQSGALARGVLDMFVPLAGRAGSPALPPDVALALLVGALALAGAAWLLPAALAVRAPRTPRARRLLLLGAAGALAVAALAAAGPAYTPLRPQRYMVFHTRRTVHAADGTSAAVVSDAYWLPHLDPHTARGAGPLRGARESPGDCAAWPYCGAPYHLPVLGYAGRGSWLAAPGPPARGQLVVHASTRRLNATAQELLVNVTGPAHVVLVVAPAAGARLVDLDAGADVGGTVRGAPGAPWGARTTYFVALHSARGAGRWAVRAVLSHELTARPAHWATLSVAGHALAAPPGPLLSALLSSLPAWTAPVGWDVHLHLLHV